MVRRANDIRVGTDFDTDQGQIAIRRRASRYEEFEWHRGPEESR